MKHPYSCETGCATDVVRFGYQLGIDEIHYARYGLICSPPALPQRNRHKDLD